MNKVKANGIEYKNLSAFCEQTGLSYNLARQLKFQKGSKFTMKFVKFYSIEIEEHGYGTNNENPKSVKKITKD